MFCVACSVICCLNVSFSRLIHVTQVGENRVPSCFCNFVVSVRRSFLFLFLLVLWKGCVILLLRSLCLPYTLYFPKFVTELQPLIDVRNSFLSYTCSLRTKGPIWSNFCKHFYIYKIYFGLVMYHFSKFWYFIHVRISFPLYM